MICSTCGTENPTGTTFCTECATRLSALCPACGHDNPPAAKFCGACATSLAAGAKASPPTTSRPGPSVSVLFADLVGFTTLAEGRDAEDTRELLSRYFDLARDVIARYGGTVEKLIGDAVMAVWTTRARSPTSTYDFQLVHRDGQVRQWIRDIVMPTQEVWVAATSDGIVVGLMALTSDTLDQLYVAPGWTGRGIGSRLLALAKTSRPSGLDLYTFEVNAGARRFYQRHDFIEVARGDGSCNEERQPDLRYAWW